MANGVERNKYPLLKCMLMSFAHVLIGLIFTEFCELFIYLT